MPEARLGRDRQRGVREGEEGEGVPGQGSTWTLSRENGGTQGRGWGTTPAGDGEDGVRKTAVDSAGRRGARASRGPGRGVAGPRGRAVVVAEGQGCPGRAAASVPWPGKPRNQAVSLTSSCSLRRLPIGQTRREARLKGPLEEATWVRVQGPEGDGRAREWGGCQLAGSPGPAPQPPAGSLTRHVQSHVRETIKHSCEARRRPRIERLGRSNIIKMSVLSNSGYKFNGLLIKIPMSIFSRSYTVDVNIRMEK